MDWMWALTGIAGAAGALARPFMSNSQTFAWSRAVVTSAVGGFVFGVAYPALAAAPLVGAMLPLPQGSLPQTLAIIAIASYVSDHVGVNVLGRFGIGPAAP